jgi:tRNA threonylcarbamoyladenosine biosynthesis protein TsaE
LNDLNDCNGFNEAPGAVVTMSTWISNSPSDTWNIADAFFQGLDIYAASGGTSAVIALHGSLGAGKTCFAQGLARAAGVKEPVCSPTYTLISEYQGDIPFHHIDLYRLGGSEEAFDLGLDEYFERGGLTVIEWAERAAELLPADAVHVRLLRGDGDEQRIISVVENPLGKKMNDEI